MVKNKEDEINFDFQSYLDKCPKPEWFKKAFMITVDTTKIKNEKELIKAIKNYEEMR